MDWVQHSLIQPLIIMYAWCSEHCDVQVSSGETDAPDRVRTRQEHVPDDSSVSQCIVLLPRLRHAEHGLAHWQTVLERSTIGLVRHLKVRHKPGINIT